MLMLTLLLQAIIGHAQPANLARVDGAVAIADSTHRDRWGIDGYHAHLAIDGNTDSAGGGMRNTSWASDNWEVTHSLTVILPAEGDLESVRIHWAGSLAPSRVVVSDKGIVYVESAAIFNDGDTAVDWGQDAVATVTWGDATTSTMNAGTGLSLKDSAGNVINLTEAGNTVTTHGDVGYVTQGRVSFQIGLTASETATMSIGSVAASALGAYCYPVLQLLKTQ